MLEKASILVEAKANAAMWKNIFAIDTVNRSAIVCVVVKVFSLV